MAIIHRATISPTKLELLDTWLGSTLAGEGELRQVGSYRLDDPEGEVGIEGLLVARGNGPVRQAVLTYRAAPLDDADDHLITKMEHSVLGRRWVYSAEGDPVALVAFRRALAGRQVQALLEVWDGDKMVFTPPANVELTLHNSAESPDGLDVHFAAEVTTFETRGPTLVARWDGGEGAVAWA